LLEWEWIASEEIIREYKEVLHRPRFNLTHAQIDYWQGFIDDAVEIVSVPVTVDFPKDRKDTKFLACALAHQREQLPFIVETPKTYRTRF